jgi:hypothetical protein
MTLDQYISHQRDQLLEAAAISALFAFLAILLEIALPFKK